MSQKPTGRQYIETHWEVDREVNWEVEQSCPTDKPEAHWDAVCWELHWEVDRGFYREIQQDLTEAAY